MHCTNSIEETKELILSLYSDSMGVNKGKRPSLYSDKHGGVKVNIVENDQRGGLKGSQMLQRVVSRPPPPPLEWPLQDRYEIFRNRSSQGIERLTCRAGTR